MSEREQATSELAVIHGSYSDFRLVKTRGAVQMVIEVPIEHGEKVMRLFGIPQPGQEIYVAVARLASKPDPNPHPYGKPEKTAGEKAVQRAAMLCKDREFQEWIVDCCAAETTPCEESAITLMRGELDIQSRRELATNSRALNEFLTMEAAFKEATGRQAEMR